MAYQELYKKHRPRLFKDVVGQRAVVKVLNTMCKTKTVPHAIMFTGPSGCGKTTLARILKSKLKCGDVDFHEVNCADFRGIEMVRNLRSRIHLAAIAGPCHIWLIDEAHRLTPEAQDALLKTLEDTPAHVYFMLATTEPFKLKHTIRTRCTEIAVKLLDRNCMETLLTEIETKENLNVDDKVLQELISVAEGSARKAIVLLEQVVKLTDSEEQLAALEAAKHAPQGIDLARALFSLAAWKSVAAMLKTLDDDPENIRYTVLGYARTILLGGGKAAARAFIVINAFRDNFYDSKQAGLALACYEVYHGQ